jgi:hypothetical protein
MQKRTAQRSLYVPTDPAAAKYGVSTYEIGDPIYDPPEPSAPEYDEYVEYLGLPPRPRLRPHRPPLLRRRDWPPDDERKYDVPTSSPPTPTPPVAIPVLDHEGLTYEGRGSSSHLVPPVRALDWLSELARTPLPYRAKPPRGRGDGPTHVGVIDKLASQSILLLGPDDPPPEPTFDEDGEEIPPPQYQRLEWVTAPRLHFAGLSMDEAILGKASVRLPETMSSDFGLWSIHGETQILLPSSLLASLTSFASVPVDDGYDELMNIKRQCRRLMTPYKWQNIVAYNPWTRTYQLVTASQLYSWADAFAPPMAMLAGRRVWNLQARLTLAGDGSVSYWRRPWPAWRHTLDAWFDLSNREKSAIGFCAGAAIIGLFRTVRSSPVLRAAFSHPVAATMLNPGATIVPNGMTWVGIFANGWRAAWRPICEQVSNNVLYYATELRSLTPTYALALALDVVMETTIPTAGPLTIPRLVGIAVRASIEEVLKRSLPRWLTLLMFMGEFGVCFMAGLTGGFAAGLSIHYAALAGLIRVGIQMGMHYGFTRMPLWLGCLTHTAHNVLCAGYGAAADVLAIFRPIRMDGVAAWNDLIQGRKAGGWRAPHVVARPTETVETEPVKTRTGARMVDQEYEQQRRAQRDEFFCSGVVVQAAFNSGLYRPIAHAPNHANGVSAVVARALKATPKPNPDRLREYCRWVRQNLRCLLPRVYKVNSMTFDNWVAQCGSSSAVKALYKRCRAELDDKGIDENTKLTREALWAMTTRSGFVKVENLLAAFGDLRSGKAPRLIQAAQLEMTVLTGPWMAAFQAVVQRRWNKNNNICFTSGVRADDAARLIDRPDFVFLEDDISAYDSSIDEQLLRLEVACCKACGAPAAVIDLMMTNIMTHGATGTGCVYSVRGTRKSGDTYTSVWNSLHNAFIHVFNMHRANPEMRLDDLLAGIFILVQGDDSLMAHWRGLKRPDWQKAMLELGFKAVATYREHLEDAEFCSCLVYGREGERCFAPKPGRVIAKFGHFVNPPVNVDPLSLLRGVCIGLMPTCRDVPPIRAVLERVMVLTADKPAIAPHASQFEGMRAPLRRFDASLTLRVRYDWGAFDQKIFEAQLAAMNLGDRMDKTIAWRLMDIDNDTPYRLFEPP